MVKTTAGSLICYDDLLSLFVEPLFNSNLGWREEFEIENVEIRGDTARLIVGLCYWYSPHWVAGLLPMDMGSKRIGPVRVHEAWRFVDDQWKLTEWQVHASDLIGASTVESS